MALTRKSRKAVNMEVVEDEIMSSYDGSYIESEEDCDYMPKKRQRLNTFTNVEEKNRVPRRPTRVPNLKIQNRNALLARENRLRKKQMMEELESSVRDLEAENRKLQKIMKIKDRKTDELMKEVRYLKSVIANRTEIVSVLKALPKAISSPSEQLKQETRTESVASSDTLSIGDNDIENGTVENDPFLSSVNIDDFSFFLNLDNIETEWDQILKNPFSTSSDFTDIPKLEIESPAASPSSSGVSSEHNYSHYDEKFLETIDREHDSDGAGVCVHINRGKVSLEFCAVCYNNNNAACY